MKRIVIILAFLILHFWASSKDFINEVFSKYSRNDGCTSIVINKDLLNFAFTAENDDNIEKLKGKISDLKILISNNQSSKRNKYQF